MYCPKCKNEYREGFTVCADCKVNLVWKLPHDGKDPIYSLKSKEIFDKYTAYLKYSEIPFEQDKTVDEDGNSVYEVYHTNESDINKMRTAFQTCVAYEIESELKNVQQNPVVTENGILDENETTLLQNDVKEKIDMYSHGINEPDSSMLEALSKEQAVNELTHAVFQRTKSFESSAHKAEEFRSSGIMLIVVSVLGIIFTFLNMTGILSIIGVLFSQIVLLSFFVILFIVGVLSLSSAKKYAAMTGDEENEISQFKNWMKDNISTSDIILPEEEILSEEERIINQQNRLYNIVSEHFPEMDETILNHFADEFYNENFLDATEE